MTRLIDAEDIAFAIEENSIEMNGEQVIEVSCAKALIDFAQTFEERPQGEWKIYKSPVDRYYQCSCCGKNSPDFTVYMKMNYCPNCGADMRGADNEQ